MQINTIYIERTESTNDYLREQLNTPGAPPLPDLTLVYTAEQTKGRGQRGNGWESAYGKNALFSLLCHPGDAVRASQQFRISQCIALAVQEVLTGTLSDALFDDDEMPVRIKWPNDIYVNDSKICGILIECDLMGRSISNCIIGVGININQDAFVSDAPNPISLRQIIGKDQDITGIMYEVAMQFGKYYEMVLRGDADIVVSRYMNALYRRDGYHAYEDATGMFSAMIADVEPTGHLVLHLEDGSRRRYEFKEVKYVLPAPVPPTFCSHLKKLS